MGKIVQIIKSLCILTLASILASCASIEHVFIFNRTNETVHITALMNTLEGEKNMETTIASNGVDGWEFESNFGKKKELDTQLNGIVISNDKGCKKELSRSDILDIVKNSSAWEINIDNEVLNCK